MEKSGVNRILEQMTLEEKIAQLMQLTRDFYQTDSREVSLTGPIAEMGINQTVVHNSGSVINAIGAKDVIEIQREHLKNNRLGIPLLFMADIVHGYRTVFPVPLAIGCSWDLVLAETSAAIAAMEASVSGLHVTFAPMVDLVRDPRWGRVMESTGEDPYLNSLFARAFVRGFQGSQLTDNTRVVACVKHFAAYGAPEGGRDYNTVNMSERQLRESYLPAYKAALDEGCEMVMTSFNTVDGIPATGNAHLLRDILRDEWGFDGVLISDWGAVKELIPHGVAVDESEAARKALLAGVDIEMMTPCYVNNLKELVENGALEEALIDEAVLRILNLKHKLGLFENPYRGADEKLEQEVLLCEANRLQARQLATKSCVLLKNENVLPLQQHKKIALIGPFAQSSDILGPWSIYGSQTEAVQLYDGLKGKVDPSQLFVAKGCDIQTGTQEQMEEAIQAAHKADVIVLALGEHSEMSGEASSRADIRLPNIQLEMVSKLKELNKPTVAVLFNGRPLDLHGVVEHVDSILEAWFPGTEGGSAIADILFGDVNPSGRLTMSFPYSVGQIPVYYNDFNTGRPKNAKVQERYVSQYLDIPNEPLFPFGFGLSYTTFSYGKVRLSAEYLTSEEPLIVSVQVTNTGRVEAEEIVQLYVRDMAGSVVRPVKELKGFHKVPLQPGETKNIEFQITVDDLAYYHTDLQYQSDLGEFLVFVGPNSRDVSALRFELKNASGDSSTI